MALLKKKYLLLIFFLMILNLILVFLHKNEEGAFGFTVLLVVVGSCLLYTSLPNIHNIALITSDRNGCRKLCFFLYSGTNLIQQCFQYTIVFFSIFTVSYTHLDVYKIQQLYDSIFSLYRCNSSFLCLLFFWFILFSCVLYFMFRRLNDQSVKQI